MWSLLNRLMGRPVVKASGVSMTAATPRAPTPRPTSATARTPPAAQAAQGTDLPGPDPELNARFTATLMSLGSLKEGNLRPAEQSVLSRLEDLAHSASARHLLPRLPAVLPKLMSLARRDDVSPRELTEHLAQDPALVAEVVRLASSPRYRASRTLGSLQDAVMVLGQQGLSQLVTNVAMRPVFNTQGGRFSLMAKALLWAQASRCAHACAYLTGHRDAQFEAYLAGMVVNAGLVPSIWMMDQHYKGSEAPDSLAFHEQFLQLGLKLSASISREWNFPQGVSEAVNMLGTTPPPRPAAPLAVLLRSADEVSKRHLLSSQGEASTYERQNAHADCLAELERVFGPETATCP